MPKKTSLQNRYLKYQKKIKVLEQEKASLLDNKEAHFQAKKEDLENKLQECKLRDSNISERVRLLLEKKRDIENEIEEMLQKN